MLRASKAISLLLVGSTTALLGYEAVAGAPSPAPIEPLEPVRIEKGDSQSRRRRLVLGPWTLLVMEKLMPFVAGADTPQPLHELSPN